VQIDENTNEYAMDQKSKGKKNPQDMNYWTDRKSGLLLCNKDFYGRKIKILQSN
jgi:hypothetical protein